MNEAKPKIFLSYAHIDLGFAKRIYSDLKRYELDIWFDKESLLPGQDWEKEIKKALRKSDFFIALLSENSLSKRGFVHSELKFSFEIVEKYFPSDSGIFIIPVRLDDCNPSDAYERLGRLHWIDVFPENEYQNGLKKILQVVSPGTFFLRSKPMELSEIDIQEMIKKHNFYDRYRNILSKGFFHKYKKLDIKGDKIVFDEFSCLMWQKSGSPSEMVYEDAKKWIKRLNRNRFAGFNDWRLPTLEEAMSLMEPEPKNERYINPIFDRKQDWIWTSDIVQGTYGTWLVGLGSSYCWDGLLFHNSGCVRGVRSGQSTKEE